MEPGAKHRRRLTDHTGQGPCIGDRAFNFRCPPLPQTAPSNTAKLPPNTLTSHPPSSNPSFYKLSDCSVWALHSHFFRSLFFSSASAAARDASSPLSYLVLRSQSWSRTYLPYSHLSFHTCTPVRSTLSITRLSLYHLYNITIALMQ